MQLILTYFTVNMFFTILLCKKLLIDTHYAYLQISKEYTYENEEIVYYTCLIAEIFLSLVFTPMPLLYTTMSKGILRKVFVALTLFCYLVIVYNLNEIYLQQFN